MNDVDLAYEEDANTKAVDIVTDVDVDDAS